MNKLKDAGFYSELEKDELEKSITKQLNSIYEDKIAVLSLRLDIERHKGIVIDNEDYKKQYDKIKREIMAEAYDIALSSKPVLPEY